MDVSTGGKLVELFREATNTIPIVFVLATDPVGQRGAMTDDRSLEFQPDVYRDDYVAGDPGADPQAPGKGIAARRRLRATPGHAAGSAGALIGPPAAENDALTVKPAGV